MVKLLFGSTTSMSINRCADHESKPGGMAVCVACSAVGHALQRTGRSVFTSTRGAEPAKPGSRNARATPARLAAAVLLRVPPRAPARGPLRPCWQSWWRPQSPAADARQPRRLLRLQRVADVECGVPAYADPRSRMTNILDAMNTIAAYARITWARGTICIKTRPLQPFRALPSRAAPGG